MAQVTCHACQAYFEVDFAPGTQFTCGACGATLQVAAAAPAAPTIQPRSPAAPLGRAKQAAAGAKKKGPAGRPTARPMNAPRPPVPTGSAALPKSGLQHAIGKDDSKKNTIIAASIGGGVLLIAIIVAVVIGSGNSDPSGPGTGDPSKPGGRREKLDPYTQAWNKAGAASMSGPIAEVKRLCDMAWQRHQSGTGSPEDLRMWESHWRRACKAIIAKEEDNALAHERLGNVLFDLSEAKALVEVDGLTEDVKDDIRFLIEEAEDEFKALKKIGRIWLSNRVKKERELAERWTRIRSKTEKARGDQASRSSDPFYPAAEKVGTALAKELANGNVDFRIDGVKTDPFAIHVHKPYVYLVQRSNTGYEDRIARKWNGVLQALQKTFFRRTGDACAVRR